MVSKRMTECEYVTDDGKRLLPNSDWCFVCGEDNHAGLKTRFYVQDGQVKTVLRPQEHHCGYKNIVHGGIVAAILDETMGWAAARAIGLMCYTADLNVRYLKHVPADRESIVTTDVIRASKRLAHISGVLHSPDGAETYARAEARFMPMSPEETLQVDGMLKYTGGEERIFDYLKRG